MKLLESLLGRFKAFYKEWSKKPEGYYEYHHALKNKDKHFDFFSNNYYVNYVWPRDRLKLGMYGAKHRFNLNRSSIKSHSSPTNPFKAAHTIHSPFRVNPSTSFPMVGAYDTRGNTYGFSNTFNAPSCSSFNSFSSSQPWR